MFYLLVDVTHLAPLSCPTRRSSDLHHYIDKTKHMWGEEELGLLNELVSPVPELFRDVAKQTIAGKIGEVALDKNATKITEDIIIQGYIIGTPKRDHKFLRKKLKEKNIDVAPYEQ